MRALRIKTSTESLSRDIVFFSFVTFPLSPTNRCWLTWCVPSASLHSLLPLCSRNTQNIFKSNPVDDISANIALVSLTLYFFFSGRLFPLLDSRRMPWGWKFWQGTLHPSNKLEYANPWFRLAKQKSVKMIGTAFVGIKFVMLTLAPWITWNCSLLQNLTFSSDLTFPRGLRYFWLNVWKMHYLYRGFIFNTSERELSNVRRSIEIYS